MSSLVQTLVCFSLTGQNVVVFCLFFYPLLLWVFLVCFACYALLHSRGHSHSPPLICDYVWLSYLISTFTETAPGHMAPTRECTHFDQSCHKSMWASDYIFFRHAKLANTFSLLCVGGRHWNVSHKEFVESEGWTPDLRIGRPSSKPLGHQATFRYHY